MVATTLLSAFGVPSAIATEQKSDAQNVQQQKNLIKEYASEFNKHSDELIYTGSHMEASFFVPHSFCYGYVRKAVITMTKHLYYYVSFEDAARLNRELIQLRYRNYYLQPHKHLVAFLFEPVTEISRTILRHLFDAVDLSHLKN